MANFPRVKPLGYGFKEKLPSADVNTLDTDHTKAVNGDDGSIHDGNVELGSVVTHRDVHSQRDVIVDRDVLATGDVVASSSLKAPVSNAEKHQPRTVDQRSIDCAGGSTSVTLDMTTYDTFLLELFDSGSSTIVAVLEQLLFTVLTIDTDREVKPGARFTIVLYAKSTQTGGCGCVVGAFPASVFGLSVTDELGRRTDQFDAMTYTLVNIGTPVVPKFQAFTAVGGPS
jgi:hypothetical protein